jgi:hypothetical protein
MSQPTINPPQVQGLPLGATSERDAAMVTQQNDANNLNALNNITTGKVGGRRRKRRILRGGFAAPSGQFVVPVVQTNYNDPMAGPQSATNQQVGIAGTFNQGSANAKYDDVTLVKGGRRRRSRKSMKSRKSTKSRKSRKSTKSRKYRKYRK